jgi:ribosomal protein S18 acetylase RimI-like enzyme
MEMISMPMAIIRAYQPQDFEQVRECYIELQEFERSIEPSRLPGKIAADAYIDYMFAKCSEYDGTLLVAEVEQRVVGFVCVWARVKPDEVEALLNAPAESAVISDLVVLSAYRAKGLGRALMDAAEKFAIEKGASTLRISALAGNEAARRLYRSAGFDDHWVMLAKNLTI